MALEENTVVLTLAVVASKVGVEIDVPPVEECPTLEEVREVLEAGEEIPYKTHTTLDYGGMHPNLEEHL